MNAIIEAAEPKAVSLQIPEETASLSRFKAYQPETAYPTAVCRERSHHSGREKYYQEGESIVTGNNT